MGNIQRAGGLTLGSRCWGPRSFCSDPYEWKTVPPEEPVYMDEEIFFRNILSRNYLHDIPEVHDSNLMSKGTDQSQIMTDKKHADVFSFWRRTRRRITDSCTETSSAEVASSSHQDLRFVESARAILIR